MTTTAVSRELAADGAPLSKTGRLIQIYSDPELFEARKGGT